MLGQAQTKTTVDFLKRVAREKGAPELPTMSEAWLPGFSFAGWYGILAPAGTPDAVVKRLNQALVEVVKSPALAERITAMGNEPVGSSSGEFDAFIKQEIPKWAQVIKAAKITLAP